MPRMLIIVGLIAIISWGAACGDWGEEIVGGCSAREILGICTRTGENTFSFEGIIDDQAVFYSDNELTKPDSMGEGESVDCSLYWRGHGPCLDCSLRLRFLDGSNVWGGCGEEAMAGYNCLMRNRCD